MVVGNEEVKAQIVCCSVAYMVITTRCGKVILHKAPNEERDHGKVLKIEQYGHCLRRA
jgi:hypothetical protein